jgi:uncharacterized protein YjbI with pentapeptide repeats
MLKSFHGEKRAMRTQEELNLILAAHERYATHRGGIRAQLAHANLDGLNLANRNLAEADFAGASLVGATMCGSNLERASLYCADLRDCNMQSARLTRADLRGASFKGARLSYAVLDDADLRTATMMLVGADAITFADRERTAKGGSGVDFSNCSLKNASFGSAKLDGANFTGALLQGACFRAAKLTNVTFKDAVLTGVNLKELAVPPEALADCVKDVSPEAASRFDELKARLEAHQEWIASGGSRGAPANFDGEDLRPLQRLLVGRPLTGLSARRAVAIGIDFSGSQLQAAKFDGADFRDANFSNADLRGISMRGTRLAHAKFDKADLSRLTLTNGTPIFSDLAEAGVTGEQFLTAILDEDLSGFGAPVPELAAAADGPRRAGHRVQ